MKLIKGRGPHDSAAACLAMVLDATLDDMYTLLGYDPNEEEGVLESEIFAALAARGAVYAYAASVEYLAEWSSIPAARLVGRKLLLSEQSLRSRMAQNRKDRFIAVVPHLRLRGAAHMVAVEKDYVFDPAPEGCPQYLGSSYSLPLLGVFCVKGAYV